MATHPLRYLFLDMNAYFASVEQQDRPELRGRPVGVAPVLAESTCCIAVSYEGKRHGVKTGTGVAEARRMCPGIQIVQARPERYVEVHRQILDAVDTVLPVDRVHSVDELSCRLTGPDRSPERAGALGRAAKEAIARLAGEHLRCSVGLAPNRFLAKVAAEMRKPDGLTTLGAEDLPHALHPLVLEDLPGIGRRMLVRLRRCGITTVEQLCTQPRETLRTAWGGVVGERWWHLLRGCDLAEPPTRRRSVGHSHVLAPEFATPEGARGVMVKLIHKAAVRLRGLDYWAGRMTLRVDDRADARSWGTSVRLTPCQDTQTLLGVFARLWSGAPLPARPLRVSVTLHDLVSAASIGPSLFDEDRKRLRAAQTMDAVNARFGGQAVYFAAMHEARDTAPTRIAFTHIPDFSTEKPAPGSEKQTAPPVDPATP